MFLPSFSSRPVYICNREKDLLPIIFEPANIHSPGSTYFSSPECLRKHSADWLGVSKEEAVYICSSLNLRLGASYYHDPSFPFHLQFSVGSLVDGDTDSALVHRTIVSAFSVTRDLDEAL